MPKSIFLLLICLALVWHSGCNNASKSELYPENLSSPATRPHFGSQERKNFLALFESLDTFPVQVSTKIGEWEGPQSKKFRWRGQPLPEMYWVLFDSLIQVKNHNTGETFYANKRFRVNDQTQALLTRVPGQYWSSQIYLFLLDTASFRITRAYRLAESWGDAGDSFYLESVISQVHPEQFRLESRQGECHPQDENYKLFKCTDTLAVSLLQGNTIKVISRKPVSKTW
jgi:hypothetical protein